MAVTIKDILSLPPFQNARLQTGEYGINNVVKQVSSADTPFSEVDFVVSRAGDFYLSGFYFAKDSLENMYRFLDTLIRTNAAGLCLIDEYITQLPEEVAAYCQEHELPVIFVDYSIPYADMITSVMEIIIFDQQKMINESKIYSLASGTAGTLAKEKILAEMNPHFQNYLTALYIMPQKEVWSDKTLYDLINFINRNILLFAAEYKNGILVLISYQDASSSTLSDKLEHITERVFHYVPDALVGVSNAGVPLMNCGQAITQAMTAAASVNGDGGGTIVYYNNLGILKLLLLLNGREELDTFCHEVLDPILSFDHENHAQLFSTMVCFLRNGRDYRKTAKAFSLHENTIRYRIAKLREVSESQSSEDDFFETLSIALKIYQMNQVIGAV